MTPKSPDFRRNKTIADLIANTRKPKLEPDVGWYRAAITEMFEGQSDAGQFLGSSLAVFQGTWENSGADGEPPFSWYLSKNGEVRFRGKITGGTVGDTILTLPPEHRPQYIEPFAVAVDGGGTANISIHPNGDIILDSISATIPRIISGEIYNDGNVNHGVGFTADWTNNGSNASERWITIYWDIAWDGLPNVICFPTNNNPVDADGRYTLSIESNTTSYTVIRCEDIDNPSNVDAGSFSFIATEFSS